MEGYLSLLMGQCYFRDCFSCNFQKINSLTNNIVSKYLIINVNYVRAWCPLLGETFISNSCYCSNFARRGGWKSTAERVLWVGRKALPRLIYAYSWFSWYEKYIFTLQKIKCFQNVLFLNDEISRMPPVMDDETYGVKSYINWRWLILNIY